MWTTRNGFAAADILLAMMIVSVGMPIVTAAAGVITDLTEFEPSFQDEIALIQLRDILMIAYDIRCEGDVLCYEYMHKDYELALVNRKLIAAPGTQIFLTEIDDASFMQKGNVVYVVFEREGKTRSSPIAVV